MSQFISSLLTTTSSFMTGMGSVLGLAGNFYAFNQTRNPTEADRRAMRSDWIMVGQDLSGAMQEAESHPECLSLKK